MRRSMRWFVILGVALALGVGFTSCGGGSSSSKKKKAAVINVTPTSGDEAGGTLVTIDTKNFKDDFTANLPIVTFGGNPATTVTAIDLDSVTATTPPGTGTVDIQVVATVSSRTARLASAFTYIPGGGQCTVSGVIPNQGADTGGTTVLITGTNFENDPLTIVTFGGVTATGFQYNSPTQIQCVTPVHAQGLVDVQVVSANRNCMLANAYTYTGGGGPTCSISLPLVPDNGAIGGGTPVTINGTDFDATTSVTFGGVPVTNFTFMSPTQIMVVSPADPLGIPAGNYDVVVSVMTGAGASCLQPNAFHYNAGGPVNCTLSGINPPSGVEGGGTVVTLTGTNFDPIFANNTVTFGGNPATVTAGSATFLTVSSPAGTGTVDVSVDTGSSTCSLTAAYTYVQCQGQNCRINAITPNTGRAGDWITITGQNFSVGASVSFDTAPATAVDDSGAATGTLLAQVPPSPGGTTVDVGIINPTGRCCTENNGFTYTGCIISDVSPNTGPGGGGQGVMITGSFGTGPNPVTVLFGAQSATVGSADQTTIVVSTPPGTGCVDVVVNDAAGDQCVLANGYCYSGCFVTSMVPNSGGTNGGGTATVTGTGFDVAMQIQVGPFGGPYQYNYVLIDPSLIVVTGTTQLTFPIPPAPSGGNVGVEITNIITQDTCLVPGGYTYNAPGTGACSISALNPNTGSMSGGTAVSITGSGFGAPGSTAGVLFRDLAATSVVVVSDTEITCIAGPYTGPMGGELVDVTVMPETSDPCMMTNAFTFTQASCPGGCALTGVSPASGTTAGGNTVTLTGSGLCADGMIIYFGSEQATATFVDEFTITAVVPPSVTGTGPVDVLYADGSGCFTFCAGCYTYN